MTILALIAATLFQQARPAKPPRDGAMHVAGHAYRLSCSFRGESAPCAAKGGVTVDHLEIRDESAGIVFEKNAPRDKPFSEVDMGGTGSGSRWVIQVSVTPEDSQQTVFYVLDPAPSGLIPFNPPVRCPTGRFSTVSVAGGGTGLGCALGNHYFTFLVTLAYDYDHHRIELLPKEQGGYSAEPVMESGPEGENAEFTYPDDIPSPKATVSAELEMQNRPEEHAPYVTVRIAKGDTIKILGAWSELSMIPVEKAAVECWSIRFDAAKVWLRVEVNGKRGWMSGDERFRDIGLPIRTIVQ
jgi:hypothetical protein